MKAMEISRTGMDVEWRRLEVIAENIANANTGRTALGETYRPLRLLSGPKAGFSQHLGKAGAHKAGEMAADTQPSGVEVYGVEPVNLPPRMVYEPANPQADAKGFVAYPGFDHAGEMTLMIKTARAYEANVVAMNLARQMYAKSLELGR